MNIMNDYEVSIDVSIRMGNIQLRESVMIPECTFEDMSEILHGFHELTLSIKKAKERNNGRKT